MSARDLLRDLEGQGFSFEARGEKLHVSAPVGALTPELRATLAEHKPELLALLAGEPSPQPYLDAHGDLVVPMDADPSACWWMDGRSVLDTLDDLGADAETRRRYEHLH